MDLRGRVIGLGRVLNALAALSGPRFGNRLATGLMRVGESVVRTAQNFTHVDTRTLQSSHEGELTMTSGRRMAYIIDESPRAINPKHGLPAAVYGPWEHQRGGTHAYYERTYLYERSRVGARFYSISFAGWRP